MNTQALAHDKQIIPISVKVNAPVEELILRLAAREDRGKSYVVRELMLRGLTLYKEDGRLKLNAAERQLIALLAEELMASE